MGAFLLFFIFIHINKNNAVTPNEIEMKRDTFKISLNEQSEVSATSPNSLRTRRHHDEYIDPFFQERYYETPQRIDKRVFKENPQPRYHYNEVHKTDFGRYYTEDVFPHLSHIDTHLRNLDPEIYPSLPRKGYGLINNRFIDVLQENIPNKFRDDIGTQKSRNNEFFSADSKDIGYHYKGVPDRRRDTSVINIGNDRRVAEDDKFYSKIQNNAHGLRNRHSDTYTSEIPFKRDFEFDDYAFIPRHDSFFDPIALKEEEPLLKNTYSDFSDRAFADKLRSYSKPSVDNYPLNLKTSSEFDELKDNTILKHSLTSSASTAENKLLSTHIKKTFDKVKDEAVTGFRKTSKYPSNTLYNELSNSGNGINLDNTLNDLYPKSDPTILEYPHQLRSSPNINNLQQHKLKHFETEPTHYASSFQNDRILNRINEQKRPTFNKKAIETTRDNGRNLREPEVVYPAKHPKLSSSTTKKQSIPAKNHMENRINVISSPQEENVDNHKECFQPLNENNMFKCRKDQMQDIRYINNSPSNKYVKITEVTPKIIKSSPKNGNNIQPLASYNEIDKNRIGSDLRTSVSQYQPELSKHKSNVNIEVNNNSSNKMETLNYNYDYNGNNYIRLVENNRPSIVPNSVKTEINGLVYKNPSAHLPAREFLNNNQFPKDTTNGNIYFTTPKIEVDSSINQNINKGREKIYTPPINVIQTAEKSNYQQIANYIKPTPSNNAVQPLNYYEINKPKVTVLNPQMDTQNIKIHQLPASFLMPSIANSQSISATVPKVKILNQNHTTLNLQPCKPNAIINPGGQAAPSIKYTHPLSKSYNKLISDILADLNKNISKELKYETKGLDVSKWPISPLIPKEITTFEVTHPCIESPRYLPKTLIKLRNEDSQKSTNPPSKAYVSTITINVLPPVQQRSNDIIILV